MIQINLLRAPVRTNIQRNTKIWKYITLLEYKLYDIRINMRSILLLILILNHAKSYKSKQVENGRVLYVFALGSRELIDCPIYSPGRRSSQKLKWLHNGESLVQVGCKLFSMKKLGDFDPISSVSGQKN